MRDSFPSDWVIQCALETEVYLNWLTTGKGVIFENQQSDIIKIPCQKIFDGKLFDYILLINLFTITLRGTVNF